jgi:hypothetical protein
MFQLYHDENKFIVNEMMMHVRFVLDQHTKLDLHSASSLEQQSACRHVAPLWHIILIPSQPVKYQLYNLWFNPTGDRTHDLLRSMRAS